MVAPAQTETRLTSADCRGFLRFRSEFTADVGLNTTDPAVVLAHAALAYATAVFAAEEAAPFTSIAAQWRTRRALMVKALRERLGHPPTADEVLEILGRHAEVPGSIAALIREHLT